MSRVGRRYAQALFNLAGGDLSLAKKRHAALQVVAELFQGKDSGKILRSPVMPVELKRSLLEYGVKQAEADPVVAHLIQTLLDVGRVSGIPEIIKSHGDLIDEAEGIARAEVVSAAGLPAADLEAIGATLSATLKRRVSVSQRQDPAQLGGFMVRAGNYLVDLTLKTRLDSMAQDAVQSGH